MAPARVCSTPTKVFAQTIPLSPNSKNTSFSELDKKVDTRPASSTAGIQQDCSDKRWILDTGTRKTPPGLCEYCSQMMNKLTNEINIPSYETSNPTCIYCSESVPRKIIIYTSNEFSRVTIPTAPLAKRSEYFFNSLAKGWKEAKSGIYHLSDTRIEDLRLFAVYIRNGDLDDEDTESILDSSQIKSRNSISEQGGYAQVDKETIRLSEGDKIIDRLISSCLLGEYLQSPGFRNAIMDRLVPRYRSFFNENEDRVPIWNLEWAFDGIRNSGLQRFVADVLNFAMSEQTFRHALQEGYYNEIVGEEIAASAFRDRQTKYREAVPWYRNACTYHDHPKGMFNSPCKDAYSMNGREPDQPAEISWEDSDQEQDNPEGW